MRWRRPACGACRLHACATRHAMRLMVRAHGRTHSQKHAESAKHTFAACIQRPDGCRMMLFIEARVMSLY